jgi:hypothetical protein
MMQPNNAARAASSAGTKDVCSLRAPDSYVHFIGKSYQKKDAMAGPEARMDAENQVEKKVCATLSEQHLCQIAKAPARRFREGRSADGSMCSVYQMKADAMDPMSKAATDLAKAIKGQVRSLGLSSSTAYRIGRAQKIDTGCGVGRLGRAITNELRKNIGVAENETKEVVTPLLEVAGQRVLVHLEHKKDNGTDTLSDTIDLTNYTRFIGWSPVETQCGTSSASPTWLGKSRQTGSELLEIQGGKVLCSGNVVTLNAFPPSAATSVELLTIEPNGKAYFMGARSASGSNTVNLGQFAVYSGMEAITATVSAAFHAEPRPAPVKTPCELTSKQVEQFGSNAPAIGSLSYDVAADGEQRCKITEDSVTRASALKNMISNIPACSFQN